MMIAMEYPTRESASENGRFYSVMGERVTCLLKAGETQGSFSLFEIETPPNAGPPLHRHGREDEAFYILDGEYTLTIGEESFSAARGAFVHLPRGVAHTYRNSGTGAGRVLVLAVPGGYEAFFADMSALPWAGAPSWAEAAAIAGRHGVELIPEGIPLAARGRTEPDFSLSPPDLGRSYAVLGHRVLMKAGAAETGGAYSFWEALVPPDDGVPPHYHRAAKLLYVREGAFEVLVGEEIHQVIQGDCLYIPADTMHFFQNVGERAGRLLTVALPGGQEAFFAEIDGLPQNTPAEDDRIREIAQRHGVIPAELNT